MILFFFCLETFCYIITLTIILAIISNCAECGQKNKKAEEW